MAFTLFFFFLSQLLRLPHEQRSLSLSSVSKTTQGEVDAAIAELHMGAKRLADSTIEERIALAQQCIDGVIALAAQWCSASCDAKRIGDSAAGRAEELLAGPIATLRFLHLTVQTLRDIKRDGTPRLPCAVRTVDGQARARVFPTQRLYDSLAFMGLRAECWLQADVNESSVFGDTPDRLLRKTTVQPRVDVVLGAGNVAAIPVTDALTKIFHEDRAVLLKMNPVNEYLGPIFAEALRPLLDAGWLRIIYGDGSVGSYAIHHPKTQAVHITGSAESHESIVWGSDPDERDQRKADQQPLLTKPITSELGNVTPWIIVPGKYTRSQLQSQVESVAASIINNGSFNCVATKIIITSRHWSQRKLFLSLLQEILDNTPPRYGYYPGCAKRHQQFSGSDQANGDSRLPWVLKTDIDEETEPAMFQRESFTCVVGEKAIETEDPTAFLHEAVDFVNNQVTGTLAANLTVPNEFAKQHSAELDLALKNLRYGTIGVNQWCALGFAWMSTPWGGYPGATLEDIQSGVGTVHNTYLLNKPEKTIIYGKLKLFPKPLWFSTHRSPDKVAAELLNLYSQPTLTKLPKLFVTALGLL